MSVLICGAGPTGLALACGLLRRGIEVRIIDAAAGPANTSRALAVQPRGAEVLDRLDALGDLPQRSIATMGLTFRDGARELFRVRRKARDHIALPIGRQPVLQRRIVATASQLGVSYRGASLAPSGRWPALPGGGRTGIAALHCGDRVPDVKCVLAEGETSRLHRILDGRWVLLVPEGSATLPTERLGEEVVTVVADVPEPMLVRPDAHLAWRASRSKITLSAYVDRVLLHP
ncbi:FAD-dependent monooxygenase [Nocardia sp. NBC_00511]|uniref:FAD-dependent monooxygenase n=1 Tax=Nocardia sp. NBC_00511 TaxID=2903591 RepID=UPI0030E38C11